MMRFEDMLDKPLRELIPIWQEQFLHRTFFHGVQVEKNPMDLWTYQKIIHGTRPNHVIEIGTFAGGSAAALAVMLQLEDIPGVVVTVDVDRRRVPPALWSVPKLKFVTGEATAVVEQVAALVHEGTAMVIEDSMHTYANTLAVVRTYAKFVKPGCYMVVEDTICNHGLPVPGLVPGPYEAVQTFVSENKDFEIDRSVEMFGLTWNPCGFLRRKLK